MIENQREESRFSPSPEQAAASLMLNAFRSVGAETFDVTWATVQEEKALFRRGVAVQKLLDRLPSLLTEATQKQQNLIVRPHTCPPVFLLQLDDLNTVSIQPIQPYAFLIAETSSGNFQGWLAVRNAEEDFVRRVRRGVGADMTASGATRLAGTLNFKTRYAPRFPRIQVFHTFPGLIVERDALEAAGLLAEAEAKTASRPNPSEQLSVRNRVFPDYQKCLDGAPLNHAQTAPDRSRADYTFCLIALDWGFSIEETATRLLEVSAKAQENGERYAQVTAQRAEEGKRNRQR